MNLSVNVVLSSFRELYYKLNMKKVKYINEYVYIQKHNYMKQK